MDIKNEKYKETRIQVGDSMAGGAEDGERPVYFLKFFYLVNVEIQH